MKLRRFKDLQKGERASRIGTLFGIVVLIIFCIYGLIYQYFDTIVVLGMFLGIAGSESYLHCKAKAAQCMNVISILCASFALGLFFMNSYPVWADRLNNISMYSSRGTLFPVITILVLQVAAILCEIVSCFYIRKEEER